MSRDYIRRCPVCGTENALDVMRCACGALLAGVDLEARGGAAAPATTPTTPTTPASPPPLAPATALLCPFEDCAQANPPGSHDCLYCNRPLGAPPAKPGTDAAVAEGPGLMRLPANLAGRYRLVRHFPTTGAEAELMLLTPLAGGDEVVAKIYRRGVLPKSAVQERLRTIPERHRVRLLEMGSTEGHAYELMEYCREGSLRNLMRGGPLPPALLLAVIRELAPALAAVHGAALVHRDLKPDNVLVRARVPLQLVLTDFGISSVLDATQRFTGTARTLHYAAPETLSGILDAKTDYWALGMLLLELAQGRHPFSGLSDAVILHHLTTRSIETSGIEDPELRKLLRGLLLRDPKARWGREELTRWLARDPSLPEPQDQSLTGFSAPYRLAGELCRNPEQLAIALSRHWQEGVSDLLNGQLLSWFREVQKDQDTVRLLLEMRHERSLHVDVQLLRLLLHLAPGLPPVWRGESMELRAILSRAKLALKGDEDARDWLDALYRHGVLETYAAAGNEEIADMVGRWTRAAQAFAGAWQAQTALLKARTPSSGVVLFDDVAFGASSPVPPALSSLHARLLAMAYAPAWADALRRRLRAEITGLLTVCPWLDALGKPEDMPPEALLALEALMPEARKAAERQRTTDMQAAQAEAGQRKGLEQDMKEAMAEVQALAASEELGQGRLQTLTEALEQYFRLLAQLRATSPSAGSKILARAGRMEPYGQRLLDRLGQLEEQLAVNRGWLSARVILFFTLTLAILPRVLGDWLTYTLLTCAGLILLWRLAPLQQMKRDIRNTLKQLARMR